MDPIKIYSSKAELYNRYRWSYAKSAIRFIIDTTGISMESALADIGAGTGILTQEFVGNVKQIYAIEPNLEMAAFARRNLQGSPSSLGRSIPCVFSGRAEALPLPDHSMDMLTVAQAVHWFEPQTSRKEFQRVLKHGGWLAILHNHVIDRDLQHALLGIYPEEYNTGSAMVRNRVQHEFFFNGGKFQKKTYPFISVLSWEDFFGALSTTSYAPDEGTSAYARFRKLAKDIFSRYRKGDQLEMGGKTEVYLGQV